MKLKHFTCDNTHIVFTYDIKVRICENSFLICNWKSHVKFFVTIHDLRRSILAFLTPCDHALSTIFGWQLKDGVILVKKVSDR